MLTVSSKYVTHEVMLNVLSAWPTIVSLNSLHFYQRRNASSLSILSYIISGSLKWLSELFHPSHIYVYDLHILGLCIVLNLHAIYASVRLTVNNLPANPNSTIQFVLFGMDEQRSRFRSWISFPRNV